jgi:hypothetical protein
MDDLLSAGLETTATMVDSSTGITHDDRFLATHRL